MGSADIFFQNLFLFSQVGAFAIVTGEVTWVNLVARTGAKRFCRVVCVTLFPLALVVCI